jgi:UDP-N-acetylglucosamine acyltransferase
MTQIIHSTAIIAAKAKIGADVKIGPYCVIGDNAVIGDGAHLHSHVVIEGHTSLGAGCEVYPFAALGCAPQHTRYENEPSRLVIGKNCVIREHVTMHPGTAIDAMETIVGDHGLFFAGAHVAHDCVVGNHVIFANNASLGGHVRIGDHVMLGGFAHMRWLVRIVLLMPILSLIASLLEIGRGLAGSMSLGWIGVALPHQPSLHYAIFFVS